MYMHDRLHACNEDLACVSKNAVYFIPAGYPKFSQACVGLYAN